MSDLFRNPSPGTLTHLLSQRDMFFNSGDNLTTQRARAMRYLHCHQKAKDAVDTHRTNFFALSGMYDTAAEHDVETAMMWEARVRKGKADAWQKKRFFKVRLNLGIRRLRRSKKGFDLRVPEREAFYGYYLNSIDWFLLELVKKPQSVEGGGRIDAATVTDYTESACFDDGEEESVSEIAPGDPFPEAIVELALRDLPEKYRSVATVLTAGERLPAENNYDAKFIRTIRSHLRRLCCAHELVQTQDGIEVMKRALMYLQWKSDRRLLLRHFTKPGPEATPECFVGLTVDELASAAEKEDESGDAVRIRLLNCLSEIMVSVIVEETRSHAFASLPRKQRFVLNTLYLGGWEIDEPQLQWKPAQWEIEGRNALIDLRYLQTLYRRALNGRSLDRMLKSKALNASQRKLLTAHLTGARNRSHSLRTIASQRGVSIERIKEDLLKAAKLLIDL